MLALGETLRDKWLERALRYRVMDVMLEMRLWEVFGSREQYLCAPHLLVERVKLVLAGQAQAEQERLRQMEEQSEGGGSSGSSAYDSIPGTRTAPGTRTTSSSFWGHDPGP